MLIKNLPQVIGHRGACGYAPENTLASVKKAHELGVAWIEFDVTLAQCGEAIIFHDQRLERTSNGHGKVSAYTYQQLSEIDVGSWFDRRFSGERVLSLVAMIDHLKQYHLGANVEIKPHRGQEIATAKKTVQLLQQNWPAGFSPPLISSFSLASLEQVREEACFFPLGLLLDRWRRNWQNMLEKLGCVSLHVREDVLTESRVKAVKEAGYAVLAYTVNDPGRAMELWSWGVDAVFSDYPDRLLGLLANHPSMRIIL